MKIYLSHNFSAQQWLNKEIVSKLKELGFEICSRWLEVDSANGDNVAEELKELSAKMDIEDVRQCNIFIHFSDEYQLDNFVPPNLNVPGRGKFIEYGYAYAMHKQIFVIGKNQNSIFYYLPGVVRFRLLNQAIDRLIEYQSLSGETIADDSVPF